jgi:hypothetical protein
MMKMEDTDTDRSDHDNKSGDTSNKAEAIAEFRSLVLTLASSRPDVLSPRNRNALIQKAQHYLIAAASSSSRTTTNNVSKDKNDDDSEDDDDKHHQDENNSNNDDENSTQVLSNAEAREVLANWKGTFGSQKFDYVCAMVHGVSL